MFSYRVFIKYCVFSKILKYIPDSGLSRFLLGVSVCVNNSRSNTSIAAELAEFRKITKLKKAQNLMNKLIIFFYYTRPILQQSRKCDKSSIKSKSALNLNYSQQGLR